VVNLDSSHRGVVASPETAVGQIRGQTDTAGHRAPAYVTGLPGKARAYARVLPCSRPGPAVLTPGPLPGLRPGPLPGLRPGPLAGLTPGSLPGLLADVVPP